MRTGQSPRQSCALYTRACAISQASVGRHFLLLKRRLTLHFWLLALPVLGLPSPLAAQSGVCPVPVLMNGSSVSNTLNVPEYRSYRPLVAGDYVVIEYDASQDKKDKYHGMTSWTDYNRFLDYRGLNNQAHLIDANGSFLPVIYAKEKIAVRVCGLHFTDVLTVTTSPNGVPEGGADVRGVAPVTPPASLSGTLDMLQSGTATGGTTTQPGLGLGAPAQLPSLTVSGITPGAMTEDQTPGKYPSYTPTSVTASGRQVVLLLYSVARNAQELKRLIDRTMGKPYAAEKLDEGETGNAPGSVNGVNYILKKILGQVKVDAEDRSNYVAFDQHLTDIQNTNAQISSLASALSSQAFASNALALLNNFSTIEGVLDLATLAEKQDNCSNKLALVQPSKLSDDDLGKLTFKDIGNLTVSQVLALDKDRINLIPDKEKDADGKTVRDRVRSYWNALNALGLKQPIAAGSDQPLCGLFEKQKADDFWGSYGMQGQLLVDQTDAGDRKCVGTREEFPTEYLNSADDLEHFAACTLRVLNEDLGDLRARLREIDLNTMELYDRMNEWYFRSSVEQTDLLPPLVSNAFVRISIVVQRGYTPFTLANAGGTFTATATTNVPAPVSAANTSTPAHSVKTILVEVHRLANFNVAGGAMFIHIPTANYAVQASPTTAVSVPVTVANPTGYTGTCGGQPVNVPAPVAPPATGGQVTYACVVQTQQTQWQLAAMVGLVWFPWGHDYFPRHSGFANYGRNLLPSVLVATSVSTLGNSMVGVNWEPVSGIDFTAGLGSAHRNVLPTGITLNTAVASGTTLNQVTQEHAGFTFGFGVDLNVFTAIFGAKTSAAGQP